MISKSRIKLIHSLEQKKFRKKEGLFVAEGPKIVSDLLYSGFKPRLLAGLHDYLKKNRAYIGNDRTTLNDINTGDTEIYDIDEETLHKISFLQTPQQILGVFEIPPSSQKRLTPPTEDLSLVLDGVQDPGNLGTIIRIADWFGIDYVFCSPDTADAYNPKVVQATMGSIARVRVVYTDLNDLIDQLPTDFPVYGTFLDGDNIYQKELSGNGLIVMGNEGNGISQALRKKINNKLLIPSYKQNTAESLNVAIATAITCAEFRRRRL